MSKDPVQYLKHIQDECEYIISSIQNKKILSRMKHSKELL